MFKKFILFLIILISFSSCSFEYDKKLKISATTWIGYTPLFYAKEKGWLDDVNIKLLNVSSLSENMYLFEAGNSDAFVGTQYEYNILKKKDTSLKPIILLDRSYGGDIIMSNLSIKDLQNTTQTIDAYLEMDSINNTILQDFISSYHLKNKKINYINKDQTQIAILQAKNTQNPTIIVTYVPYNITLSKNGYQKIVSTKDGLELLVIDAMFTKTKTFHIHEQQFIALKKIIDKSIDELKKDKREFYETIKPYMLNMNYDEFKEAINDIIWINKEISPQLKKRIGDAKFPMRDLI